MNNKNPEHKILAILAIIFGGIGIVLSWVPIVNNIAFFFGIVALILGIVAFIRNRKGKKILTTIGTFLGVATIAIVLGTQAMYGEALDTASKSFNKSVKTTTTKAKKASSGSSQTSSSSSSSEDKIFSIGENVDVTNGLRFKVNNVQYNTGSSESTPDAGKTYVIVNVTLTNIGKKSIDYDDTDFDISDNGNRTTMDEDNIEDDNYDDEIQNVMESGTLDPGATITTNLIGQAVRSDKLQFIYTGEFDNGAIRVALN